MTRHRGVGHRWPKYTRNLFGRGSADLTLARLGWLFLPDPRWRPWPTVCRSFLYLRGCQTRRAVALASPSGAAEHGMITLCRACRSVEPCFLRMERGLQREPNAVGDCVPCVCPTPTPSLSRGRSSLGPPPCPSATAKQRSLSRAGETRCQVRRMWSWKCGPFKGGSCACYFVSGPLNRRAGLGLDRSIRLPVPDTWHGLDSGVRYVATVSHHLQTTSPKISYGMTGYMVFTPKETSQ